MVALGSNNNLLMFVSNAAGLGPQQSQVACVQPQALVLGDVTADGLADVVIACQSQGAVQVLQGLGDGSFAAMGTTLLNAGGAQSYGDLWLGDLNADGRQDALVADTGNGKVVALLGDGAGGWTGAPQLFAQGPVQSLEVGDVNRDGYVDVLAPLGTSVLVGLNTGTSALLPGTLWPSTALGTAPGRVALQDVDGDGNLDLLAPLPARNRVELWTGDGSGAFVQGAAWVTGTLPVAVKGADMNGRGAVDVVVLNQGDGAVSVLGQR